MTDKSEVISIIVPVYNASAYLQQTLDSIIGQTYKAFELILVDDGSKDESGSICDVYASKDNRVKVYHNENIGAAATRNFGLAKAAGEYIVFVDSDDVLELDFLETMLSNMSDEVDLVLCGYDRFYNDDLNNKKDYLLGDTDVNVFASNKELCTLFTIAKTSLSGVSIWAKLYRKSIIEEYNIEFPVEISYEEDCCFNVQYYRHVRCAVSVRKSMYHYRQQLSSLSKDYKETTFKDLVNGYNERKKLFAELNMSDADVKKLDTILLIVIFNTFKKIAKTNMSHKDKKKAYKKVLSFEESKNVVNSVGLSKVKLTRYLTIASRHEWIWAISLLLWMWRKKDENRNNNISLCL